jgi:predicted nuclease of restriction endonuclease-like RecB superfamily
LLPDALLPCSIHGRVVVPHFLGAHDQPWLRVLVDEYARFVGRRQRELDERLREPLPCASPPAKRRVAVHVLSRLWGGTRTTTISPRCARAAVFMEAARSQAEPAVVVASVAAQMAVAATDLKEALFADLPGERLVAAPAELLSPGELALRTNLAIAQAFLFRSAAVLIEMEGNARAVVRHAKLRGLICSVAPGGDGSRAAIEISGPYALFRRTMLYGRALSEMLPLLVWCHRFRLRADCTVRGQHLMLQLGSGDPIFPAKQPRLYDSKIEERFAQDFRRIAPDWDVLREPEPVPAGEVLIFPDFVLEHRRDGRRWFLEIVGFWTPQYVERKLALLRAARLGNLILCVDEARSCADAEVWASTRVIPFRRRIDAVAVMRVIDGEPGAARVGRGLTERSLETR